jgi:hypothetical protein
MFNTNSASENVLKLSYEGALVSPKSDSDLVYENRAYGSASGLLIPDEYILTLRSPARDQRHRGTCAAFVGSTISEYKHNINLEEYMSPEFIYHHRKTRPDSGMYGRDVFNILKNFGCVPESLYEYLSHDESDIPNEMLYEVANKYRIMDYARVETIMGLKLAMLGNEVAYLLLPAYNRTTEFWEKRDNEPIYHAVAVIGYNKKGFVFKNSWGPGWGHEGYGCFPYNRWDVHAECWVALGDNKSITTTTSDTKLDYGSDNVKHSKSLFKKKRFSLNRKRTQSL